jgi:pimeloyl-ACP methyl ester carboxylesterase
VPRRYIQTLQDRAVTPGLQNAMLAKLPCERVLTIDTSHTPFFAAPEELAAEIITLSTESQAGATGS